MFIKKVFFIFALVPALAQAQNIEKELYTKQNIEFLAKNLDYTSPKITQFFYKNAQKIDSAIDERGYSQRIVDYLIFKSELEPAIIQSIDKNLRPDWQSMYIRLKKSLDVQYAKRNVINAKVKFYHQKKDWGNYAKSLVRKVENIGYMNFPYQNLGLLNLNNMAYEIFLFSNKKKELEKALLWSELVIKVSPTPNRIDTKACLLYKIGRRKEAIALQEYAFSLAPDNKNIKTTLDKMKEGVKFWTFPN